MMDMNVPNYSCYCCAMASNCRGLGESSVTFLAGRVALGQALTNYSAHLLASFHQYLTHTDSFIIDLM